MPVIVACPSCGGKLRIADDLRGQMVRCPACNHTFESAASASARPQEPLDLPLELADEGTPSAPSSDAPGLHGAVEIKLSLDDQPHEVPWTEEPPRRTGPPQLADVHDDLRSCPACGKHVHRDARRCRHCGERFEDEADDGDDLNIRQGRARRDAEPDRGAVVLTLGIIGIACLSFSCFPVGAILGLVSWMMGRTDLRKMKAGQMDEIGEGLTRAGWICGIIGTLLNTLALAGCMLFVGGIWVAEMNRPPLTSRINVKQPAPLPNPRMK